MRISVTLARLMGPLFLVMGAGMLLNGDIYRAMAEEFVHSHALIYFSGVLALLAGLAIVNAHNVWALEWRVVITLFGWLALLGGVVRIVAPQFVAAIGTAMLSSAALPLTASIIVLALGGLLSFKGYTQ